MGATAKDLDQVRRRMREVKNELEVTIRSHFPIGHVVSYQHASVQRARLGVVDMHGYDGDVRIRILQTGQLIWVRGGMDDRLEATPDA